MEWAFTPHRARRAGAGEWLEGGKLEKQGRMAACLRCVGARPAHAKPHRQKPGLLAVRGRMSGAEWARIARWRVGGALQTFSTLRGQPLSQFRPPPSSPQQRPRRRRSRHKGRLGARGAGKARPGGMAARPGFSNSARCRSFDFGRWGRRFHRLPLPLACPGVAPPGFRTGFRLVIHSFFLI